MPEVPDNILVLRDTIRQQRLPLDGEGHNATQVGYGEPPPSWLPDAARPIWSEILQRLLTSGRRIGPVHLPMLAVLCERMAAYREAVAAGRPVDAADIDQLRRLAGAFGLLPESEDASAPPGSPQQPS